MPIVCPRCGNYGYLQTYKPGKETERGYYRVKHVYREGGKERYKYCYIGPISDYAHVNTMLYLDLTNIMEQDYRMIVERAIENYIGRREIKEFKSKDEYMKYIRGKRVNESEVKKARLIEVITFLKNLVEKLEKVLENIDQLSLEDWSEEKLEDNNLKTRSLLDYIKPKQ